MGKSPVGIGPCLTFSCQVCLALQPEFRSMANFSTDGRVAALALAETSKTHVISLQSSSNCLRLAYLSWLMCFYFLLDSKLTFKLVLVLNLFSSVERSDLLLAARRA